MPGQISLDDSSYEEIYEKAMETLHRQAPWWTHTEVSDPGITLLEMWALLVDMQSFYLDQVQESHFRKYLKLLGIRPDEGECARAWLFFELDEDAEEEYIVPEGTKLLADRMVFETEEEVCLCRNRLVDFRQGSGGNQADVMSLLRKTPFALKDGEGCGRELFSFRLEKALRPGSDFRFFLLLDERGKRNRAEEGFRLVQLVWEYELRGRWHEAEALRDDTAGLLYSGMICLRMGRVSGIRDDGIHRIRCRIRRGAYDRMPVLYKICLNVAGVIQRDTVCRVKTVEFTGDCHRAELKSYLARTGRLTFYKRVAQSREQESGKGELWEDITDRVCVDAPVRAGSMERWVSYEGTGKVRVLCTAGNVPQEELESRVTGVASQRIDLPWRTAMRSGVELMIRQEDKRYRLYRREEPEEDRYPNAWHWEADGIVLGDGRHGDIPPPSADGLRLISLALCEGEKGNVSVGKITKWERPELFPHITCENRLAGAGGRDPREPSEQMREIREMLARQDRMVTEEDIQRLAMETPGLMIRKAEAGWKEGCMVVKIFPACPLESEYCRERYRNLTEKYLESFRLAGTVFKVEIANGTGKEAE